MYSEDSQGSSSMCSPHKDKLCWLENITRRWEDIHLTIVRGISEAAAAVLGDYAGAVVILDAGTGEILAAASSPSYDPTEFVMGISPSVGTL